MTTLAVIDGQIQEDRGHGASTNGVYGGVDLSLDEFDLSKARTYAQTH